MYEWREDLYYDEVVYSKLNSLIIYEAEWWWIAHFFFQLRNQNFLRKQGLTIKRKPFFYQSFIRKKLICHRPFLLYRIQAEFRTLIWTCYSFWALVLPIPSGRRFKSKYLKVKRSPAKLLTAALVQREDKESFRRAKKFLSLSCCGSRAGKTFLSLFVRSSYSSKVH